MNKGIKKAELLHPAHICRVWLVAVREAVIVFIDDSAVVLCSAADDSIVICVGFRCHACRIAAYVGAANTGCVMSQVTL